MCVGGCSWIQRNVAHPHPLIHSQDNWSCVFNAATLFKLLFPHCVTDVSTACLPRSRNIHFSPPASTHKEIKDDLHGCLYSGKNFLCFCSKVKVMWTQIIYLIDSIWFFCGARPYQTPPKSDLTHQSSPKLSAVSLLILCRRRDFMADYQSWIFFFFHAGKYPSQLAWCHIIC